MKFIGLDGKKKTLAKAQNYRIDWDGYCRSNFQREVRSFLRPFWGKDVVFEEFRLVGTRLSLDFYNASLKVAIEVQGQQHTKYVGFFHKNRQALRKQFERDEQKLKFCKLNDINLVELYTIEECTVDFFKERGVYL
tara:strand:+ start:5808 stop:6215 length:408 start_codon:yes stop_codon:yes gene_type:complete